MYSGNSNAIASLQSVSNQNDDINSPNVFSTFDATHSSANITVYNGGSVGGTGNTWIFDKTGKLTLPGALTAKRSADLILKGGQGGPTSQFATSNAPSFGYGGTRAIFTQSDFTSGLLSDAQVGNIVVDNNGEEFTIVANEGTLGGPGTTSLVLDRYWSGAAPYTFYSGYGPDANVTVQAGTASWTFSSNGNIVDAAGKSVTTRVVTAPVHSYGATGDKAGDVAYDDNYFYHCKQDYADNSTNIWVRVAWTSTTW
jgi:hypothetical protein